MLLCILHLHTGNSFRSQQTTTTTTKNGKVLILKLLFFPVFRSPPFISLQHLLGIIYFFGKNWLKFALLNLLLVECLFVILNCSTFFHLALSSSCFLCYNTANILHTPAVDGVFFSLFNPISDEMLYSRTAGHPSTSSSCIVNIKHFQRVSSLYVFSFPFVTCLLSLCKTISLLTVSCCYY